MLCVAAGWRYHRPEVYCVTSGQFFFRYAQLPRARLRKGVRQDVAPEGAPALAHG